jgi:serpin B
MKYVGDEMSMVLIVPDAGTINEFEAALTPDRLGAILATIRVGRVDLKVPKFDFEFDLPLKDTLAALGMPDAFAWGLADFSGMDGSRNLFIQDVLHKAFVGIDEQGTEAAAATAVVIGWLSLPPRVTVDRPFVFLIRDIETGTIIFLGRVLDPTA